MAYKLQLPVASQIHPVLHAAQLKKGSSLDVQLSIDDDLQLLSVLETLPPTQVMAHHLYLVGDHVVPSVLVQRESFLAHWATWEATSLVSPLLLQLSTSSALGGRAAT